MFHIAKVVKNKRNKLYATNKLPFSQQTFTQIQLLQNTTRGHPIPPHCIQGKSGRTPHNSVLVSIPLHAEVYINFL